VHSSKSELLETIEKIVDVPILVVGDIMLDRYIWGRVERISPEAPVPVVAVTKTEDRLGGAGNVVRNLTNVGAKVSLCGFIGDDDEGQVVLGLLEKYEVEREGVLIDRGRPTSLKTRVIAHAQQLVRIDREDNVVQGVALREGFAAVMEAQIEASKAVIVSDYGKGAVSETIMTKFSEARQSGLIGAASRPFFLDPHPDNYDIYLEVSIAKPNRREAEAASGVKITGKETATQASKILMEKWGADMILITLGEDGLAIFSEENKEGLFLDTVAREVYDVSGAGDTVTALFSAGLAVGASAAVAGDLANIAAGIVVSEVGTVAVSLDRLKSEVERLGK